MVDEISGIRVQPLPKQLTYSSSYKSMLLVDIWPFIGRYHCTGITLRMTRINHLSWLIIPTKMDSSYWQSFDFF